MMDAATLKFALFLLFGAGCLVGGYVARQRGWLAESVSRQVHYLTVVCTWTPVSVLSFWALPLNWTLWLVMGLQPVVMLICGAAAWTAAKAMRLSRDHTGVLIGGAMLSNMGFTLGAYLCYVMLHPADQALGYAIAGVIAMQLTGILVYYPIARSCGSTRTGSLGKLIAGNLIDLRALPLYAAVVGMLLSAMDVPQIRAIDTFNVKDVLFFIGAAGSYGGIGLRLRLGDWTRHLGKHAVLAGARFVLSPLVVFGLVMMLDAVGWTLGPLPHSLVLMEAMMPAAIASVIVPNLFGLDARLASVLWLVNTILFCVLCLPVILWVW